MLLLTFAGVAVVVAGFRHRQHLRHRAGQRTRRTALLRLIGATRGQVFRPPGLEMAVRGWWLGPRGVGVSLVGGTGRGLPRLDVPVAGGLTVTARTVLTGMLLGTAVTMCAAVVPAWRGTRVARSPRSPMPPCSPPGAPAGTADARRGGVAVGVRRWPGPPASADDPSSPFGRVLACSASSCSDRSSFPRWPGCSAGRPPRARAHRRAGGPNAARNPGGLHDRHRPGDRHRIRVGVLVGTRSIEEGIERAWTPDRIDFVVTGSVRTARRARRRAGRPPRIRRGARAAQHGS